MEIPVAKRFIAKRFELIVGFYSFRFELVLENKETNRETVFKLAFHLSLSNSVSSESNSLHTQT